MTKKHIIELFIILFKIIFIDDIVFPIRFEKKMNIIEFMGRQSVDNQKNCNYFMKIFFDDEYGPGLIPNEMISEGKFSKILEKCSSGDSTSCTQIQIEGLHSHSTEYVNKECFYQNIKKNLKEYKIKISNLDELNLQETLDFEVTSDSLEIIIYKDKNRSESESEKLFKFKLIKKQEECLIFEAFEDIKIGGIYENSNPIKKDFDLIEGKKIEEFDPTEYNVLYEKLNEKGSYFEDFLNGIEVAGDKIWESFELTNKKNIPKGQLLFTGFNYPYPYSQSNKDGITLKLKKAFQKKVDKYNVKYKEIEDYKVVVKIINKLNDRFNKSIKDILNEQGEIIGCSYKDLITFVKIFQSKSTDELKDKIKALKDNQKVIVLYFLLMITSYFRSEPTIGFMGSGNTIGSRFNFLELDYTDNRFKIIYNPGLSTFNSETTGVRNNANPPYTRKQEKYILMGWYKDKLNVVDDKPTPPGSPTSPLPGTPPPGPLTPKLGELYDIINTNKNKSNKLIVPITQNTFNEFIKNIDGKYKIKNINNKENENENIIIHPKLSYNIELQNGKKYSAQIFIDNIPLEVCTIKKKEDEFLPLLVAFHYYFSFIPPSITKETNLQTKFHDNKKITLNKLHKQIYENGDVEFESNVLEDIADKIGYYIEKVNDEYEVKRNVIKYSVATIEYHKKNLDTTTTIDEPIINVSRFVVGSEQELKIITKEIYLNSDDENDNLLQKGKKSTGKKQKQQQQKQPQQKQPQQSQQPQQQPQLRRVSTRPEPPKQSKKRIKLKNVDPGENGATVYKTEKLCKFISDKGKIGSLSKKSTREIAVKLADKVLDLFIFLNKKRDSNMNIIEIIAGAKKGSKGVKNKQTMRLSDAKIERSIQKSTKKKEENKQKQ